MRCTTGPQSTFFFALAGMWLITAIGCSSFAPSSIPPVASVTEFLEKKEPIVEPERVAVVWTPAMLEKEGSRPTRGFGGMVTFYAKNEKTPVRVDGELTVYAYDRLSHDHEDPTPDRKYVFKPEQLKTHYGDGPLGPSYSIWIPWDAAGGPRQEVGLIVRFDSVAESTVMGKPTHNVLSGPKPASRSKTVSKGDAQGKITHLPPVDGVDSTTEDNLADSRMKTVTLTVPSRTGHPEVRQHATE